MTDELHNLDLFLDSDKSDADLLGELDALKGLLSDPPSPQADDDIPVLSEVVAPTDEQKPAGFTARTASTPAVPPRTPLPGAVRPPLPPHQPTPQPTPAPAPAAPPLKEKELEVMVDRLIDKEMPRIRVELKRVLLAELRLRGVLK